MTVLSLKGKNHRVDKRVPLQSGGFCYTHLHHQCVICITSCPPNVSATFGAAGVSRQEEASTAICFHSHLPLLLLLLLLGFEKEVRNGIENMEERRMVG